MSEPGNETRRGLEERLRALLAGEKDALERLLGWMQENRGELSQADIILCNQSICASLPVDAQERLARLAGISRAQLTARAHEAGDLERAIGSYTRALEIRPRSAALWLARGTARFARSEIQGALDDFVRACELDPNVATHWKQRGQAEKLKGDVPGAIASLSRAIALARGREQVDCLIHRSAARRATDPDGALADAEAAIALDPRTLSPWFNKGEALLKKGMAEDAIVAFTTALQLQPSPVAFGRRAAAYIEKGEHASAVSDLTRALEMAPSAADFWFDRGYARAQLLDLEGAQTDLTRAIELDPSHPRAARAYACRGLIRAAGDRPWQGAPDLIQFLVLAPAHPSVPLVRERLEEARGR